MCSKVHYSSFSHPYIVRERRCVYCGGKMKLLFLLVGYSAVSIGFTKRKIFLIIYFLFLLTQEAFIHQLVQESILPSFFFIKRRFFRFMLLSLSVSSIRNYCMCVKLAKLNSKNWKNKEIEVWQDWLQVKQENSLRIFFIFKAQNFNLNLM